MADPPKQGRSQPPPVEPPRYEILQRPGPQSQALQKAAVGTYECDESPIDERRPEHVNQVQEMIRQAKLNPLPDERGQRSIREEQNRNSGDPRTGNTRHENTHYDSYMEGNHRKSDQGREARPEPDWYPKLNEGQEQRHNSGSSSREIDWYVETPERSRVSQKQEYTLEEDRSRFRGQDDRRQTHSGGVQSPISITSSQSSTSKRGGWHEQVKVVRNVIEINHDAYPSITPAGDSNRKNIYLDEVGRIPYFTGIPFLHNVNMMYVELRKEKFMYMFPVSSADIYKQGQDIKQWMTNFVAQCAINHIHYFAMASHLSLKKSLDPAAREVIENWQITAQGKADKLRNVPPPTDIVKLVRFIEDWMLVYLRELSPKYSAKSIKEQIEDEELSTRDLSGVKALYSRLLKLWQKIPMTLRGPNGSQEFFASLIAAIKKRSPSLAREFDSEHRYNTERNPDNFDLDSIEQICLTCDHFAATVSEEKPSSKSNYGNNSYQSPGRNSPNNYRSRSSNYRASAGANSSSSSTIRHSAMICEEDNEYHEPIVEHNPPEEDIPEEEDDELTPYYPSVEPAFQELCYECVPQYSIRFCSIQMTPAMKPQFISMTDEAQTVDTNAPREMGAMCPICGYRNHNANTCHVATVYGKLSARAVARGSEEAAARRLGSARVRGCLKWMSDQEFEEFTQEINTLRDRYFRAEAITQDRQQSRDQRVPILRPVQPANKPVVGKESTNMNMMQVLRPRIDHESGPKDRQTLISRNEFQKRVLDPRPLTNAVLVCIEFSLRAVDEDKDAWAVGQRRTCRAGQFKPTPGARTVTAQVDPGGGASVISRRLARKLQVPLYDHPQPMILKAWNNTVDTLTHYAVLVLAINGVDEHNEKMVVEIIVHAQVADSIADDFILGKDAMDLHDIELKEHQRQVQFLSQTQPINVPYLPPAAVRFNAIRALTALNYDDLSKKLIQSLFPMEMISEELLTAVKQATAKPNRLFAEVAKVFPLVNTTKMACVMTVAEMLLKIQPKVIQRMRDNIMKCIWDEERKCLKEFCDLAEVMSHPTDCMALIEACQVQMDQDIHKADNNIRQNTIILNGYDELDEAEDIPITMAINPRLQPIRINSITVLPPVSQKTDSQPIEEEDPDLQAELEQTKRDVDYFQNNLCNEYLSNLRPQKFPEELWQWVPTERKPIVQAEWQNFERGAPPGRVDNLLKQIAAIDISKESTSRRLEEPILRAQCYANIGAWGYPDEDTPPPMKTEEFQINLIDKTPFAGKMRRMPKMAQASVTCRVNRMAKKGMMRKSSSAWNSPVNMVANAERIEKFLQKHGDNAEAALEKEENIQEVIDLYRMTNDFRQLNQQTKLEIWPLPNIPQLWESLRGHDRFSASDICDAFFCVPVAETSRQYTAFSIPSGHWEYCRLPMGCKNSPAFFSRAITPIFEGMADFIVYIDDVVNHKPGFLAHFHQQQEVYTRIQKYNLTFKPSKTHINFSSQRVLGHIINKHGRAVSPKTISSITKLGPPTTLKQVRSFLGLVMVAREYIENLAEIARPIQDLTKKGVDIPKTWGKEHDEAFEKLKTILTSTPVLALADFSKPFRVEVDACRVGHGLGAILLQEGEKGWRPVAYWSRHLSDAERNYSATHLECTAMHDCILHWAIYLQGTQPFTVVTDHYALVYMVTKQGGAQATQRLLNLCLDLQAFEFNVEHRNGLKHLAADAVSRLLHKDEQPYIRTEDELRTDYGPLDEEEKEYLRRMFANKDDYNFVVETIEGHTGPDPTDRRVQRKRNAIKQSQIILESKPSSRVWTERSAPLRVECPCKDPFERHAITLCESVTVADATVCHRNSRNQISAELPLLIMRANRVVATASERLLTQLRNKIKFTLPPYKLRRLTEFSTEVLETCVSTSEFPWTVRRQIAKELQTRLNTQARRKLEKLIPGTARLDIMCAPTQILRNVNESSWKPRELPEALILVWREQYERSSERRKKLTQLWVQETNWNLRRELPPPKSISSYLLADIIVMYERFRIRRELHRRTGKQTRGKIVMHAQHSSREQSQQSGSQQQSYRTRISTRTQRDLERQAAESAEAAALEEAKALEDRDRRIDQAVAEHRRYQDTRSKQFTRDEESRGRVAELVQEKLNDYGFLVTQHIVNPKNNGLYEIIHVSYDKGRDKYFASARPVEYEDEAIVNEETLWKLPVLGPDGANELVERMMNGSLRGSNIVLPLSAMEWREAQKQDKYWAKVIDILEDEQTKLPLATEDMDANKLNHLFRRRLTDGSMGPVLRRITRLQVIKHGQLAFIECKEDVQTVIPDAFVPALLFAYHEAMGHPGHKRMIETMRMKFFWSTMHTDIKDYVQQCQYCLLRKASTRGGIVPSQKYQLTEAPFDIVHVDLTGEFPKSYGGMQYILVYKDKLTKYVILRALPNKEGATVKDALAKIFLQMETPLLVVSDRGTEFTQYNFGKVCKLLNIEHNTTTPSNPRSNGLAENFNATLKNMLASYVNRMHTDWDQHLDTVAYSYNTTVNDATGYTPYFLLFGREANLMDGEFVTMFPSYTLDEYAEGLQKTMMFLWKHIGNRVVDNVERMNIRPNQPAIPHTYQPNDYCFIKRIPRRFYKDALDERRYHLNSKLQYRYTGPHRIVKKVSEVIYKVDINGRETSVHLLRMKPGYSAKQRRETREANETRMQKVKNIREKFLISSDTKVMLERQNAEEEEKVIIPRMDELGSELVQVKTTDQGSEEDELALEEAQEEGLDEVVMDED